MSQNIKIKGKNPYDVLTFTLTQKCSTQCEKQVSLFTGGTCFACFNIEGIWWSIQIPFIGIFNFNKEVLSWTIMK